MTEIENKTNAALARATTEGCDAQVKAFLKGYEKRFDDARLLRLLCPKAKPTYLGWTAPYIDHHSSNAHVMLTYPYRKWPEFKPVAYPAGSVKLPVSKYGHHTEAALVPLSPHGEWLCRLVDMYLHFGLGD
ncbi:MAG TPA: hypothetical protein PL133_10795 [Methylophilaceae bacterium]|nr:hypothetical protein [Methylophilaceae bacterium]